MGQSVIKLIQELNGRNTQWDPIEAPEGSFREVENVSPTREGALVSRRGFERYGGQANGLVEALLEFKDRLIRHANSDELEYDSDGAGTWTAYSGTFERPDSENRIRSVEARETHFLVTEKGLYSHDALTSAPTRAGIPGALDIEVARTGTGLGPLAADSQVAYQLVFERRDTNGRLLVGADLPVPEIHANALEEATYSASGSTITVTLADHGFSDGDAIEISETDDDAALAGTFTITNTTTSTFEYTANATPSPTSGDMSVGKSYDASITFTLPDDVLEGDLFELYRTPPSASATTTVGSEFRKVVSREITSSDISTGTITFTDSTAEDFLGAFLYTNPSQGATAEPNHRPPWAGDVAFHEGHLFLSQVEREQEIELQLQTLQNLTAGTSSVTVNGETYTFETAEDVAQSEFELVTSGTLAEQVRDTAKSLVRVINRASSTLYAHYVSTFEDSPGKIRIFRRTLKESSFAAVANATATGANFEPALATSGTDVSSSPPGGVNFLAISKNLLPHAFPHLRYLPVGAGDDPIVRIHALRDALLVWKKRDGLYVLLGRTDNALGENFVLEERDATVQIRGREAAVVAGNAVFAFTNQGFVRASASGVEIVGREIENEVQSIEALSDWEGLAHAVSYDSEHLYVAWGPATADATEATFAWVYNTLTGRGRWTNWRKDVSAARVLSDDDKLYVSHGTDDYVLQERKALDGTSDHRDEGIGVTVTAFDTTELSSGITVSRVTVTYTYTGSDLAKGFEFSQGSYFTLVESVEDLGSNSFRLTLMEQIPVAAGAATVYLPIEIRVVTQPLVAKGSALLKQYVAVHVEFEEDLAFDHFLGFRSDLVPDESFEDEPYITLPQNAGWGASQWGVSPWGDPGDPAAYPLLVSVPLDYSRARRLQVIYEHRAARQKVVIAELNILLRNIHTRHVLRNPL